MKLVPFGKTADFSQPSAEQANWITSSEAGSEYRHSHRLPNPRVAVAVE